MPRSHQPVAGARCKPIHSDRRGRKGYFRNAFATLATGCSPTWPGYRVYLLLTLAGLTAASGCAATRTIEPPLAPMRTVVHEEHGRQRVDPYYWLRDRHDPETIAYLEAENAYAEATMGHTQRLQDRLYNEMKGRIKETDLTVPRRDGDFHYYTRTFAGKQYPVYCRQAITPGAAEEVLLDPNELARGHGYFRLGTFRVSPDHTLLAYSTDTDGSESYTLHVKDLRTGTLLPDRIPDISTSVQWANDNRTLFYSTMDHAKRPDKLYRHLLGTDPADDQLVHHEADEFYRIRLSRTRSDRYLLLTIGSQITSEVRFLDADQPLSEFRVMHPREHGMEYSAEHHGDHFYLVTNDRAINFRLVRAPVANPGKAHWEEVIPHRPAVKLDGVDAFAQFLTVYEREEGLRRLRVRPLDGRPEHYVEFPEPVYTFFATDNSLFDTDTVRLMYTSLVTPRTVYDYHVADRTLEMKKQDEIPGGYDASTYVSERIQATARDGTSVPISLVYRRGLQRDGNNPTLLYGYGSYGATSDPFFSSERISLLDRGFIYAIAHIRGGGDLGRPWYEQGKLLHKRNTFTDFIDCAEHLVAQGYTRPDRLAAMGGSAGGLLMGAVVNMRPDLFGAVIAKVPFVDVVTTMLDASIPLTVVEYEEWGNPNEPTYFEYMLSYSPYDNVAPQAYPQMLITAGLNDPRVAYWEPAKWTAKLRTTKTGDNRLLLKTNMGAGHGGASGRYDRLREIAFDYAFLLDALNVSTR